MNEETARFYDGLPNLTSVYRGCARYRIRGLSWTTNRTVALESKCVTGGRLAIG
jgi:hypothetical protein